MLETLNRTGTSNIKPGRDISLANDSCCFTRDIVDQHILYSKLLMWSNMKSILILLVILFNSRDLDCALGAFVVDNSTKELLLDQHNDIRWEVGAANMRKLSWDDALEKQALDQARTCPGSPYGNQSSTSNISSSMFGENFFWMSGESAFSEDVADTAVYTWDSNKEIYNSTLMCQSDLTLCLQYIRLIWAENDKMGCGAASCPTAGTKNGLLVCCVYGPTIISNKAQYNDSSNIYMTGEPCSKCGDRYGCEDNLCVSCDSRPTPATCFNTTSPTTTSSSSGGMKSRIPNTTARPTTTSGSKSQKSSIFLCSVPIVILLRYFTDVRLYH